MILFVRLITPKFNLIFLSSARLEVETDTK